MKILEKIKRLWINTSDGCFYESELWTAMCNVYEIVLEYQRWKDYEKRK